MSFQTPANLVNGTAAAAAPGQDAFKLKTGLAQMLKVGDADATLSCLFADCRYSSTAHLVHIDMTRNVTLVVLLFRAA